MAKQGNQSKIHSKILRQGPLRMLHSHSPDLAAAAVSTSGFSRNMNNKIWFPYPFNSSCGRFANSGAKGDVEKDWLTLQ